MLQDIWLAIDERRYEQAETQLRAETELLPTRAGQMALGYIYAHTGRADEARSVFANLREQHRGDDWEHIAAHQQGRAERLAGDCEAALKFLAEERDLITGANDAHKLAVNALEMALCLTHLERYAEARERLEYSLEQAKGHDDPETLARTERALGDLSVREGHPDAARVHFERAIHAFEQAEDDFGVRETQAMLEGV